MITIHALYLALTLEGGVILARAHWHLDSHHNVNTLVAIRLQWGSCTWNLWNTLTAMLQLVLAMPCGIES
jgi:hypothetical protein